MLEQPGVSRLLSDLELYLNVAIKFYKESTPDLTLDYDVMARLSAARINYGLELYLWNVPG